MQLWDYEVVEAFFLSSSSERYLELEFGPHGQHLVLLLDGRRNAIKHSLPLEYQATIDGKSWKGKAKVKERIQLQNMFFKPLPVFRPGPVSG